MAARRLVIVMVVLLGISSLAALLAPPAERDETTDTTTTTRAQRSEPSGRFVRATIDTRRPRTTPHTIRIRAGDQLALVVRHTDADEVEIPRLGELEDVDRDSPARFDLLPQAGRYPVRLAETGKAIGEIVVRSSGSLRRG